MSDQPGEAKILLGEERLRSLDHLLQNPSTLAFLLVDQAARREDLWPQKATLAGRVRRLLGPQKSGRPETPSLHHFSVPGWQRLDAPLTFLGCRSLLRVQVAEESRSAALPELEYCLTEVGVRWIEERLTNAKLGLGAYRDRCKVIREILWAVMPQTGAAPGSFANFFQAVQHRLQTYRAEEHVLLTEDLLARFFLTTFGEPL